MYIQVILWTNRIASKSNLGGNVDMSIKKSIKNMILFCFYHKMFWWICMFIYEWLSNPTVKSLIYMPGEYSLCVYIYTHIYVCIYLYICMDIDIDMYCGIQIHSHLWLIRVVLSSKNNAVQEIRSWSQNHTLS